MAYKYADSLVYSKATLKTFCNSPSEIVDIWRRVSIIWKEEAGIFNQGGKDKKDARKHPRFDGRQALGFRSVGRHRVENIDQDQKQGD